MSDEILIELVKQYPVLYDQKQKDYKDQTVRNALWEEISRAMNIPATTCKDNWTKLRNAYASALKRRRTKSGQAAAHVTPWKFEEQMSFLSGHMETRQTLTNVQETANPPSQPASQCSPIASPYRPQSETPPPDYLDNATSSENSVRSSASRTNNKRGLQDIYNLMQRQNDLRMKKYQTKVEMDETDHFFLSMSKSLKRLPTLDQTKIKLDLHKAIHDAEIRQIEKNHSILATPITITSCRRIEPTASPSHSDPISTITSYQQVQASASHSRSGNTITQLSKINTDALAQNSQEVENSTNANSQMSLYFSTVMPEEETENVENSESILYAYYENED